MRIIAGAWRSRLLVAPEGGATRPTADRVRETLFSMLGSRIGSFEGLTVLDLFAGSGALALEALSRGAAQAFLVEGSPAARAAIIANIRALGANATLIGSDATRFPGTAFAADLVFLDPPYRSGLAGPAISAALTGGWVGPATWITVETAKDEIMSAPGLAVDSSRSIGPARITLMHAGNPAS